MKTILRRSLRIGYLPVALSLVPLSSAQNPAVPAAPVPPAPIATVQDLRILALTGNGAVNDLQRRIMAPLVVQVLDTERRPVEGVDVTFRFPANGPSATFSDGQPSRTTRTNA